MFVAGHRRAEPLRVGHLRVRHLPSEDDQDAIDRVIEDGDVDGDPLDGGEKREAVDLVDLLLKVRAELGDGGVDEQVDDEVAAEHDAGQGMEPPKEEMRGSAEQPLGPGTAVSCAIVEGRQTGCLSRV